MTTARLTIERLGQRGEGLAVGPAGPVYTPYTIPGDVVLADIDGESSHLLAVEIPSPDRIPPICPYFGTCGGCAVQELATSPYAAWKHRLVVEALTKAGVRAEVAPVVDADGDGRRRATIHARQQASPNVLARRAPRVGFMRARAHEVVDIERCPILAPGLRNAFSVARQLADLLADREKPLDLVVTSTESGLDVDLRGLGPVPELTLQHLTAAAGDLDLARLANHGDVVIERRAPTLMLGTARLTPPPGAFLQATTRGEQALAELVSAGIGGAPKVADLFCGIGTFALRLAETATVTAVDVEGPALGALLRAARTTRALRAVTTEARDLFHRPLSALELERFDAVVFDPPRAGAAAQAAALAASKVQTVVAVSCNPATFARDAAVLVGGGFGIGTVTPVDQFRYSPHVEIVATFRRAKPRRGRTLFG